MENSLKGLLLAAGTIITCVIVGLGFFIAREARDTAANGAGQIARLNAEFNESDKVIYDGLKVSGSEVVNVINKYKNELLSIEVKTKKGTSSYNHTLNKDKNAFSEGKGASVKAAQDRASDTYINPNGQFLGSVVRDDNKTIIGICFEQED